MSSVSSPQPQSVRDRRICCLQIVKDGSKSPGRKKTYFSESDRRTFEYHRVEVRIGQAPGMRRARPTILYCSSLLETRRSQLTSFSSCLSVLKSLGKRRTDSSHGFIWIDHAVAFDYNGVMRTMVCRILDL